VTRAERLLALLQLLRAHRFPVSGATLARELGVSVRTLYRDIAALQAQGADIEGEPGLGYVMRPGFMLPPLMFSEEELEALVLGSRWVARRSGDSLSGAAKSAIAKIAAVLPAELRAAVDASALLIGPVDAPEGPEPPLEPVRRAIRDERKLALTYVDAEGRESRRVVWPFAVGYFERMRIVVAWCEARQAFRHFRADRIRAMAPLDERYPTRRQALLADWRARENIPEQ
jgi:predicted DNA-binding transcriptional regulator YafY